MTNVPKHQFSQGGLRRRRGKRQNLPNTGETTGRRLFVKATVGEVRRLMTVSRVPVKKIRHSGVEGWVEVIFTQQGCLASPGFILNRNYLPWAGKRLEIAHQPPLR